MAWRQLSNIWGLACCAPAFADTSRRPSLLSASILFSLAFATKVTTVFGFAAAVAALYFAKEPRLARRLVLFTVAGMVIVLVATQLTSGNRALQIMTICAHGGTNRLFLVTAPLRLFQTAVLRDCQSLVLLVLSISGLLAIRPGQWRDLGALSLIASLCVLGVIMGSPGTDYNHFIDAAVLALVFIAVQVARKQMRMVTASAVAVSAIGIMLGLTFPHHAGSLEELYRDRDAAVQVVREGSSAGGPVLCQSPLIPILAGTRPYMLDPFMFRLISRSLPGAAEQMREQLEEGYFSAVVLETDPITRAGRRKLENITLGKRFARLLLGNYRESERYGRYIIFRPEQHPAREAR
ncbi:MAG: hypothetical protein KAY24_01965 [Candidatus Eisenbacteria sp.]|nr:hypothetical protein [Candidatus Eisenbacteria bacterium]